MDSNEQNNISGVLKKILEAALIILIFIVFILFNTTKDINYKFSYKQNIKSAFNEIKEFDEKIEDNYKENITEVFNGVANNKLNIKINGYEINSLEKVFLDGKIIDSKYLVLKDSCLNYIKELGLNMGDISEINFLGNLEDLPCNFDILDLKQNGEIAREVYDATLINENLLDIQIKVNVVEKKDVDEAIVEKYTDDLYMGQNEILEGEKGQSLLYKEITYEGLEKNNEKVVREMLIKSPINTVIKKGSKNPYYDGIAFLYRPTSGGYMTSLFGEERVNSYHKGIDIAKDIGSDVIASFDGIVKSAGYNDGGYGNLIVVEHDGNMETYYAHLNDIYVAEGDVIKKGDIIGAIGSTGYSTGPHLHFELRIDGVAVNPEPYIE